MKAQLVSPLFLLVATQCIGKPKQEPRDASPASLPSAAQAPAPAPSAVAPPIQASAPSIIPSNCGRPKLVEGRSLVQVASRPKPEKGVARPEPNFETCVVRATDHAKDGTNTFSRNDYSRRQAFNADSTYFITISRDDRWYLYDTQSLRLPKHLAGPGEDAEPHWHPTNPNTLYYGDDNGGLRIHELNVVSNTSRVVADLTGKLPWPTAARASTAAEGSPSRDARYWGFQVETSDRQMLGFAVWDLVQGKLVSSLPRKSRPDHVSMSPSGRWFVSSGDDEGTVAWSRDFSKKFLLQRSSEHSDLALGADGHDYYVSIDYESAAGYVFMVDLDRERRVELFSTYIDGSATSMHFSGKAFDKPGWVLVSTYAGKGAPRWYTDRVFAMELRPNPKIYQLAAHHSVVQKQYFAEPHASVNRDFTWVIFNSNWDQPGSLDIDAYLLRLPPGAFP
ncbi:MAG: WD40 repeat domain-containing protein [Myxococcota bacterium]